MKEILIAVRIEDKTMEIATQTKGIEESLSGQLEMMGVLEKLKQEILERINLEESFEIEKGS